MSTVVFCLRQRPSTIVRVPFIQHARPASAAVARATSTSPAPLATPTARASVPPAAQVPWEQHPQGRDIAALRSRVAHVALPDGLRAHFAAQLSDEAAAKLGHRLRTPAVLHDVVDDLPPLLDDVLAGAVPGFGPAALRYTLDLAGALSEHWERQLRVGHARAEAASRKDFSLDAVIACHVELTRRTRDILPAESPERESLDRAAKRERRTLDVGLDAVESTLGVVARVFERAAGDSTYALFLDDAGFTSAAVASIVAPVRPALDARRDHGDARAAVSSPSSRSTGWRGACATSSCACESGCGSRGRTARRSPRCASRGCSRGRRRRRAPPPREALPCCRSLPRSGRSARSPWRRRRPSWPRRRPSPPRLRSNRLADGRGLEAPLGATGSGGTRSRDPGRSFSVNRDGRPAGRRVG
jgi:hypothetical protein